MDWLKVYEGDDYVDVNIKDMYALNIEQASEYFNIGVTKLRKIINTYSDSCDWLLMNGNKALIKRKKFENFLDNITTI